MKKSMMFVLGIFLGQNEVYGAATHSESAPATPLRQVQKSLFEVCSPKRPSAPISGQENVEQNLVLAAEKLQRTPQLKLKETQTPQKVAEAVSSLSADQKSRLSPPDLGGEAVPASEVPVAQINSGQTVAAPSVSDDQFQSYLRALGVEGFGVPTPNEMRLRQVASAYVSVILSQLDFLGVKPVERDWILGNDAYVGHELYKRILEAIYQKNKEETVVAFSENRLIKLLKKTLTEGGIFVSLEEHKVAERVGNYLSQRGFYKISQSQAKEVGEVIGSWDLEKQDAMMQALLCLEEVVCPDHPYFGELNLSWFASLLKDFEAESWGSTVNEFVNSRVASRWYKDTERDLKELEEGFLKFYEKIS